MSNQPGAGGPGQQAQPANNNPPGSDPLGVHNPLGNIPGPNDPNAAPE